MRTDRGRCPPAPPADYKKTLRTASIHSNPEPWARLFWKGNAPLAFSRSTKGNRFDPLAAPWSATEVLYAGTSIDTAIAEVLLRWHSQIEPGQRIELSEAGQLRDRRVARFLPKRELTVIDATGLGLAPIEEAVKVTVRRPEHAFTWESLPPPVADDIFSSSALEYAETQRWGAWFRTQCPDADGLQWVSRQFNLGRCLVLFGDRCRGELELLADPMPLYASGSDERRAVDRMVAELGWGIY